MKLVYIILYHLRNKLGIRNIPLLYVVRASVVSGPIREISPTLTYSKDTEEFHDELIARALHSHPGYSENKSMILKVLIY